MNEQLFISYNIYDFIFAIEYMVYFFLKVKQKMYRKF